MNHPSFAVCLVLIASLIGCSKKVDTIDSNHIVLVGVATHAKGGIGVFSEQLIYKFDMAVYSWDEKIVRKKIRVDGKLFR